MQESQRRLSALRAEISEWTELRGNLDSREQFATQLSCLHSALADALGRLSYEADGLDPASLGEAYEVCRTFDGGLLTVRRLWRWFADKFEQRDHEPYARVLSAADEVVWSVYAAAMRAANDGMPPPPSPLAYLDDLSAPEAIPRDLVPLQLQPDVFHEALQAMLARLPIPVVGLPAGIADEPWQLALLGHEVGHHLQYDLLPDMGLIASIGAAVSKAAGDGAEESEWRWWSREIFADLVGLVALGPASMTVLLPLELGTEQHMLDRERDPRYPAPAVRLALIAAMATKLGLPLVEYLSPPTPTAPVKADLAKVSGVAEVLVGHQIAGRTMAQLTAFSAADYVPGGPVSMRARQLTEQKGVTQRGTRVVRSLVSAGVVAWQQVAVKPDADERTAALGYTLIDRIVGSAELGTRGGTVRAEARESAASLGEHLAAIVTRDLTR